MKHIGFASVVVGLVSSSCVEQGPGPQPKKIDPAYVQSHLLAAAPAGLDRFDIQLGDVAVYLGNSVDKTRVPPGQSVTITHYWKVLKAPSAGWRPFALLRGPAGTADFMNLPPSDMNIAHGPATWEPGEIVEDVHTVVLRPDWRSKEATVLVGLIEEGKHGALDRMDATGGPPGKVVDRAIIARVLEVDLSRAPAPKGTAHIPRAQGLITIDGVGTDAGWVGAVQADLVTAEGAADPPGKAVAKMTWDDAALYIHVAITDSDIVSPFKQHDDALWQGDCVEVFIDADSNKRGYIELQANPLGVTFDSWAETRQKLDKTWDSTMQAAAKLRGSVEAGDSGDQGWDVELAIPWETVKGRDDKMQVALPPRIGDRWRLNIVRVDRKTGAKPTDALASSWNRITLSDFHAVERMLTVVFADQSGSIVPQAKPIEPAGSGSAAGVPPPTPAPGTQLGLPAGMQLTEPDVKLGSIAVEISATGELVVAGKRLGDAELETLFRAAFARDKTTQVVIVAPNAPHARVVAVMESAKRAGLTRLALADKSPTAAALGQPKHDLGVADAEIDPTKASLVLEILNTGQVIIGGQPIKDADLERVFRSAFARDKLTQVILRADRGAQHGRVVKLMEAAKAAGLTKIAIGTPSAAPAAGSGSGAR